VLKEAMKAKKTVFMDFVTARYEKVYPMVPAGASITRCYSAKKRRRKKKSCGPLNSPSSECRDIERALPVASPRRSYHSAESFGMRSEK